MVNTHHDPIEYVNVGIVGTNKGIISDENGYFSLEKLGAKPTDSIYFSHLSYQHKVLAYRDISKENTTYRSCDRLAYYYPKNEKT